ncbi:Uncharacterised protein [Escherichia coli]|uniref:Uncharacterized protein n=1 Tax=Escherichia coli TaxID=562 RepID=A0A376LKB9_ECOLX|nr:Uncharacterised protein [Escherichia coli]
MRRRFFEKVFIIHYFWEHSETIFPNYRDGAKGRSMKFRVSHFRSSPVSTIRYQAAFLRQALINLLRPSPFRDCCVA